MRSSRLLLSVVTVSLLLAGPTAFAEEPGQQDLGQVSAKLLNPVSDLWSLSFQNKFTWNDGDITDGSRKQNGFVFQPITPVPLTEDWNLINRTIIPIVYAEIPEVGQGGIDFDSESGLGDIALLQLLSPADPPEGMNILGAGWTWIFPTASDDDLGSEKLQIGPAAAVGRITDKYVAGALAQQWWSIAGDDDRDHTSHMSLQYFLQWRVTPTTNIGMTPTITADWEADSDDRWSVPVGLGFSTTVKIGKMPISLAAEMQYYAVQPDTFGPEWSFVLTVTPVILNPFKKPLF